MSLSKATQLNPVKILEDFEKPLADLLIAIPSDIQSEEGIWALLLDKVLPLLKELSAKAEFLLDQEKEIVMPLKSLLIFIEALQPYRTQSLKALLNLKTLLPLLQRASQLDFIQQLAKSPLAKAILGPFSALDPGFFSSFYHFDFRSLVDHFLTFLPILSFSSF